MTDTGRDHGGGIDAAARRFGGDRADWLDLSTGINPRAYPVGPLPDAAWTTLPDTRASSDLISAARACWDIPGEAGILAVPGASSAIARIPRLLPPGPVQIPGPTYNEHAAAFRNAGWHVSETGPAQAIVLVHPNNPDGRYWTAEALEGPRLKVIDESFCDVTPDRSLAHLARWPGVLILKSFGKFWGLAGLRLGFVAGDPDLIGALREDLGPWPVSGPALEIGTRALSDRTWSDRTRTRLARDAARLDELMTRHGAVPTGGTPLFRLYDVDNAQDLHNRLCHHHILTRVFPYSASWIRLGLPDTEDDWQRLEGAL
ncbi:MAG: threonine-phosphate decarboxylase CobD [Pseudomonadota bacterium]